MPIWTKLQINQLIVSFKKYPYLYDTNDKCYKNKTMRQYGLRSIYNELKMIKPEITEEDVKIELQHLCSTYISEKKKMNKAEHETSEPYTSTLWYFDKMQFLDDYITETPKLNDDGESSFMEDEFCFRLNSIHLQNLLDETGISQTFVDQTLPSKSSSNLRSLKRKRRDSDVECVVENSRAMESFFGKYIACSLKAMTEKNKIEAINEINCVLYKYMKTSPSSSNLEDRAVGMID